MFQVIDVMSGGEILIVGEEEVKKMMEGRVIEERYNCKYVVDGEECLYEIRKI